MATATLIMGYGGTASRYVMAVNFGASPLSSKVKYECYDNDKTTFPSIDTLLTTANDIFSLASQSMIYLHDTTSAGPGATTWAYSGPYAGGNTGSLNFMKGTTDFVTQQGATLSSGGTIFYNMRCKVISTVQTSSDMGFDLLVRYTFTSTTPTVTFFANGITGSDFPTSPKWVLATPGTMGVVHCRIGTTVAGPYLANIPTSGNELTFVGVLATRLL